MKTDPRAGAYPSTSYDDKGDPLQSGGLTKMESIASGAFGNLLANPNTKGSPIEIARNAVTMAKALVQALNE